ncbi:MAG: hypothetical protein ACK4VI_00530 [Alphaproteobacteria bacterium]
MTTDTVQDKTIRLNTAIKAKTYTPRLKRNHSNRDGLELTRMQNFVDGGHDIFDILEQHAANTQMKIRTPLKRNTIEETDLRNSNLFTSLLKRLREQMREMV